METTPASFSLIMPRPSPKMEQIYSAMLEGFPNARINEPVSRHYFCWGLIGDNIAWMKSDRSTTFVDMPYNGRLTDNDFENSYWRICVGDVHNNDRHNVPSDRFDQWNKEIKPYREGEYILVCPSSQTMTHFMNNTVQQKWVSDTINKIRQNTKRPVLVRLKPRRNGTSGPSVADTPLEQDLANAHALVTNGSLTAIEALLDGVPVFSDTKQCPAAWCTNTDFGKLDNPEHYEREELMYNLAYKQFSIPEMRNGTAYELLHGMGYYQGV